MVQLTPRKNPNNYWLDANIILRYVIADDRESSITVKRLIEKIAWLEVCGYINTLVLYEVVSTLENTYKLDQKVISKILSNFISISGIEIIDLDKEMLKAALQDYGQTKVDFSDCIYKQLSSYYGCKLN